MEYFDLLPDELLTHIISYLHAVDVGKLSLMNSRLRSLSLQTRHVDLSRTYNCSPDNLLQFLKLREQRIRTLDLSHNHWLSARNVSWLYETMGNLTHVDIRGCCVDQIGIARITIVAKNLVSLAFTDRAFHRNTFSSLFEFLNSLMSTNIHVKEVTMVLTSCIVDLSFAAVCPELEALHLDAHLNMNIDCECKLSAISERQFDKLKKLTFTPAVATHHYELEEFIKDRVNHRLNENTLQSFEQLMLPFRAADIKIPDGSSKRGGACRNPPEIESISAHPRTITHLGFPLARLGHVIGTTPVPTLRFVKLYMDDLADELLMAFPKLAPNLQYLTLSYREAWTPRGQSILSADFLAVLASCCPWLRGLGLPGIHIHPKKKPNPVLTSLGRLKRLQFLCMSPCVMDSYKETSIFDIAEDDEAAVNGKEEESATSGFVKSCPGLTELELMEVQSEYAELNSMDFPVARKSLHEASVVTDSTLYELAKLSCLQRLTLCGAPMVRHGNGFSALFEGCPQLTYLSLAHVGLHGHCTWLPGLSKALEHATVLQDLRIEHRNLDISTAFQKALMSCRKLRRVCIITENGKIQKPSCFADVFEECRTLNMLLVVSADSGSFRKTLKSGITKKFKASRVPLCVVFTTSRELSEYPQRQSVLKHVPNIDLGELVLFNSHVCNLDRIR